MTTFTLREGRRILFRHVNRQRVVDYAVAQFGPDWMVRRHIVAEAPPGAQTMPLPDERATPGELDRKPHPWRRKWHRP